MRAEHMVASLHILQSHIPPSEVCSPGRSARTHHMWVWLDFSSHSHELTWNVGNANCMADCGALFSAHDVDRREQLSKQGVAAQRLRVASAQLSQAPRLSQTSKAHQSPTTILDRSKCFVKWFQEHHWGQGDLGSWVVQTAATMGSGEGVRQGHRALHAMVSSIDAAACHSLAAPPLSAGTCRLATAHGFKIAWAWRNCPFGRLMWLSVQLQVCVAMLRSCPQQLDMQR